ncbi:MAG: hypothetical protein AAGB13_19330 [Cyanobacteria bacterium P01_F01_bin.33]
MFGWFMFIYKSKILIAAAISLSLILFGCGHSSYEAVPKDNAWLPHVIVANERGKFDHTVLPKEHKCSWKKKNKKGSIVYKEIERFKAEPCHYKLVFDQLAYYIDESVDPKLMIFIHGGLTTSEDALKRVIDDYPHIREDGYYPIFLNWQSGGIRSYFDQITEIRDGNRIQQYYNDKQAKELLRAAAPLYFLGDVAESIVTAPVTWFNQATRALSRRFVSAESELDVDEYTNEAWNQINHSNNVIQEDLDDTERLPREGNNLFVPVQYAFRLLTGPFIDTMGETAWSNMRRSSRAVFRSHLDFTPKNIKGKNCPENHCKKGTAAFARFFQNLDELFNEDASRRQRTEITLIAHSMGTIVANDAIRDFDLLYDNLVYLGAASSIRHFYNTVVPILEEQSESDQEIRTRFYNLMLHPKLEHRELNYMGLLPSGSLLEWIDNMYVESDSILDRTLGNWNNVSRVKHVFSSKAQNSMIFRVFPKYRNSIYPRKHGDFTKTFKDGKQNFTYRYWHPASWGNKILARPHDRKPDSDSGNHH